MPNHKYMPLEHADSIRLIVLHPGLTSLPVSFTLHHHRLQDRPLYEALSYTWATEDGDQSFSRSVLCDGLLITVTENCEAALRATRLENLARVLWVDAVCINQEDEAEKNQQVALMPDVYRSAISVSIWLGKESANIDKTTNLSVSLVFFDYLARIGKVMQDISTEGKDCTLARHSPEYHEPLGQLAKFNSENTESALIDGMIDIVQRRWWQRLWVVQEAALAQSATLICSNHSARYSDFYKWYSLVQSDQTPSSRHIWSFLQNRDHLESVRRVKESNGMSETPFGLLQILYRARRLTCFRSVDRIFGLLGLSPEFKHLFPKPDYARSSADIFTEVTRRFIGMSKSIQILTQASSSGVWPKECPSWVVNWSEEPIFAYSPNWWEAYNAANNSEAICFYSDDDKVLHIQGVLVDQVKTIHLADLDAYRGTFSSYEKRLPGWQQSCETALTLSTYLTGEPVRSALWRTLCGNFDVRWNNPADDETGNEFEAWYQILVSGLDASSKAKAMAEPSQHFGSAIRSTAPLCVTSKGYLASVPYTTMTEDCLVVLTGGRVPFVLRPGQDHYRLVGPCYVHGIMDGEAFSQDPSLRSWFSIR